MQYSEPVSADASLRRCLYGHVDTTGYPPLRFGLSEPASDWFCDAPTDCAGEVRSHVCTCAPPAVAYSHDHWKRFWDLVLGLVLSALWLAFARAFVDLEYDGGREWSWSCGAIVCALWRALTALGGYLLALGLISYLVTISFCLWLEAISPGPFYWRGCGSTHYKHQAASVAWSIDPTIGWDPSHPPGVPRFAHVDEWLGVPAFPTAWKAAAATIVGLHLVRCVPRFVSSVRAWRRGSAEPTFESKLEELLADGKAAIARSEATDWGRGVATRGNVKLTPTRTAATSKLAAQSKKTPAMH